LLKPLQHFLMKTIFCILFLILSLQVTILQAQEFSKEEQYKQALQNAKSAFEAKQYSQAVLFYREAQQIKPESLLPRYKIEDIRTIYIEKELNTFKKEQSKEVKHLSKKEKVAQQKKEEEQIQKKATLKMNQEAEVVKKELTALKVTSVTIQEDEVLIDNSTIEVEPISADREVVINPLDTKKQESVSIAKDASEPVLKSEKREVPAIKPVLEDSIETQKTASLPVKKEVHKQMQTNDVKDNKTVNQEERKVWIEQEQKRLALSYPNKRTVEEFDKPGKHIIRIIMNIDNKVVIYLKVKHSWGATYFFIEEVGQELRSINEQYFNLMTNLDTYGN